MGRLSGGQSYRLDGETLRPTESSFQREVLKRLDGIDSRLASVEAEQRKQREELTAMHDEQLKISTRVDMLLWGGGIAFALMTVVVAIFTLWLSTPKGRKHEDTPPASQPIILQIPPYPYGREQEKQSPSRAL
ncbi:MAG: hypothetical protein IJF90_11055 [Synergistaceae bacterium]|nr:hypothetical protein [Synergistaceae bacterium]